MKRWSTVQDFIASGKAPTSETVAAFEGFASKGDGGASFWVKTGSTGVPSQSPTDLNAAVLTDSQGVYWRPTSGAIFYFDGANQWFPAPFGNNGAGLYQFDGVGWNYYEQAGGAVSIAVTTGLITNEFNYDVGTALTFAGYSAPGDGGGAQWVKTATVDTPSQTPAIRGDGTLTDAAGAVWELSVSGEVNARAFGMFGGESTSILQSIANWSDSSKSVKFTDNFSIVNTVTFANGASLDFTNIKVDCTAIPAGATGNDAYGLIMQGEQSSSSSMTADISEGDSSFETTSGIGLEAGDLVFISSNQAFIDGYGNPFNKRGEVLKVKSVSGNTFTTYDSAYFSYLSGSGLTAQRLISKDYNVSGGNFKFAGEGSVISGIKFEYVENPTVLKVNIDGAEDCGFQTWYCYGGSISGCTISNITSPGEGPSGVTFNSGYGVVAYGGTRGLDINRNYFLNCRRGVTGGGEHPALHVKVSYNYVSGGFNGLGTHEPCFEWDTSHNTIEGLSGVGLNIRGQKFTATSNIIRDCGAGGVRVRNFYSGNIGIDGVTLTDNQISNVGGAGVWLDGNETDGRISNVTVKGGTIEDCAFNGFLAFRSDDVIIEGVTFGEIKAGTEGANDGNFIVAFGTDFVEDFSTNIKIVNCNSKTASLNSAVRARYVDSITIDNFHMSEATPDNAIDLENCNNVQIKGGEIKAPSTATSFLFPVLMNNCNSVTVNGVSVYGFPAQANVHGVRIQSSTSSEDHVITGCSMYDCDKAVSILSAGTNHSVVTGNNGRNCTNATKFDVSSANQVVANNLA